LFKTQDGQVREAPSIPDSQRLRVSYDETPNLIIFTMRKMKQQGRERHRLKSRALVEKGQFQGIGQKKKINSSLQLLTRKASSTFCLCAHYPTDI
jgi:hypothetical protein